MESSQALDRMVVEKFGDNQIRRCSELTSTDLGIQLMGSISREWTNEKHSLYLDSMEASFVRQLHSHGYHSINMSGQHSRLRNLQDPNMSLHSNGNDRIPSSQFKVLRSGCWKKINFESAQPKMNTADESRVLVENQWIRHFRSADKHQELSMSSSQENGACSSESIFSTDRQNAASYKEPLCTKKLQAGYCHQRDQDYISCSTDQNFADEDNENKHISDHVKAKKMKTADTGVLIKDQVIC
ncbi:hypothetical protein AQUCO_01500057v1 [Aquilegia coerulea]|uniref:Uncharacterized protein n=1 Tax=Aquilegia coerulea TaxID=218851 RepID=A0A2G5DSP6_AQUCA|nr:hypothetical protein AQUCO_01500057v1 [Aquilegia coerulea]